MRHRRLLLLFTVGVGVAGCTGNQSALDPAGPAAGHILTLWHLMLAVCGLFFAAVLLFLAVALRRPAGPAPRFDGWLGLWGGLIVVGLVGLTLFTWAIDRNLASAAEEGDLEIELVARQWWWQVTYADARPDQRFETANELHVPIGRPVHLTLKSADVIHSFWVPNLHGKQDLIPGRVTELRFTVDRPGTYRGQCAEFCGLQHAHMALLVIAQSPDEFAAWQQAQRLPAGPPQDDAAQQGLALFTGGSCALCHTVRGTGAGGRNGPDLTHLASRQTLAAATLPRDAASLAGWLLDPHAAKPGNHMPMPQLPPDAVAPLVAFLEGLQ